MKEILIFFVFILAGPASFAQKVVSSAGETSHAGNIELNWTLGEPIIETAANNKNILTQGFHQTKLIIDPVDLITLNSNVSVFPNPTCEFVNVQLKNFQTVSAIAELYTLEGKLLKQIQIVDETTVLNVKELPNGSYLLKLRTNNERLQTFKLVKIF